MGGYGAGAIVARAAFSDRATQRAGGHRERAAKQPAALVIVPTRELAIQVTDDIKRAGAQLGARR